MAPTERRAAIIQAILPLLRERGFDVSTRDIAQAAGVAEGTIFRAFADKRAILLGALEHTLDFSEVEQQIGEVPGDSAADVVTGIVEVLSQRMNDVGEILTMARASGVRPWFSAKSPHRGPHGHEGMHAGHERLMYVGRRAFAAVEERLSACAGALSVSPREAASAIILVMFATAKPIGGGQLPTRTVCAILSHGVVAGPLPTPEHCQSDPSPTLPPNRPIRNAST
ncbi:MAG: TetR/AcrR family transcriptional regulator [Bifidobacteriaceae bacterium]|jgi:AcrR family transcriptional regulator|nr:TetR/AcrR family transcriptional regulator [Bifidobacteriaceae bacterium]